MWNRHRHRLALHSYAAIEENKRNESNNQARSIHGIFYSSSAATATCCSRPTAGAWNGDIGCSNKSKIAEISAWKMVSSFVRIDDYQQGSENGSRFA